MAAFNASVMVFSGLCIGLFYCVALLWTVGYICQSRSIRQSWDQRFNTSRRDQQNAKEQADNSDDDAVDLEADVQPEITSDEGAPTNLEPGANTISGQSFSREATGPVERSRPPASVPI